MKKTLLLISLAFLLLTSGSAFASHYELQDIDLVPADSQERLAGVGITDTKQLLDKVVSPAGRKEVAALVGLDKAGIDRLARTLELMQITGIGPKAANLLLEAGINSVAQLATADPKVLLEQLVAANAEHQITGVDPDADVVNDWIAKASSAKVLLQ